MTPSPTAILRTRLAAIIHQLDQVSLTVRQGCNLYLIEEALAQAQAALIQLRHYLMDHRPPPPPPSRPTTLMCQCGTVLIQARVTPGTTPHPVRVVAACGACTQTGGFPVLDEEEE